MNTEIANSQKIKYIFLAFRFAKKSIFRFVELTIKQKVDLLDVLYDVVLQYQKKCYSIVYLKSKKLEKSNPIFEIRCAKCNRLFEHDILICEFRNYCYDCLSHSKELREKVLRENGYWSKQFSWLYDNVFAQKKKENDLKDQIKLENQEKKLNRIIKEGGNKLA